MNDEFERLDRLLLQLGQVLEAAGSGTPTPARPRADSQGEDGGGSAELSWQKLDLLYESMGSDALGALLRRQGMGRSAVDEALAVLDSRRRLMP